MYTPRAFAENDLAGLDALIAHDAFVTLVHQHEGAPRRANVDRLVAGIQNQDRAVQTRNAHMETPGAGIVTLAIPPSESGLYTSTRARRSARARVSTAT